MIRHPAALLLATALAASMVLACTGEEPKPVATEVTPTVTSEKPDFRSPPTPTRTPRPTVEPPALTGDIVGWFSEPRPEASRIAVRTIPVAPDSPFAAYERDRAQVVLYDVQAMTERTLGIGGYPWFSPDGTRLAWVTGKELHQWDDLRVLDLRTGEERSLGTARAILRWEDNNTLHVAERANDRVLVNVSTGDTRSAAGVDPTAFTSPPDEAAGYRLEVVAQREPYPFFRSAYRVTHIASGRAFTFDAFRAVMAPDGAVFLATVPEPAARSQPNEPGPNVGLLGTNLFEVDPATRQATFIATVRASYPNWPLAASEDFVVWQQNACTPSVTTQLYDRRDGSRVEVRGTIEWPRAFTPAGLLASGAFGAKRLIDPATLQYRAVLPGGFSDVRWTPDYRYAVVGAQLGHGGLCGG